MVLKPPLFDPANYQKDEESLAEFLRVTYEDGTPADIAHALGVVARAASLTWHARPA